MMSSGLFVDKDLPVAEDLLFEGTEEVCSEERRKEEGEKIMVNVLRVNPESDGMERYFKGASAIFSKIGSSIYSIGSADSEYWNTVRIAFTRLHFEKCLFRLP